MPCKIAVLRKDSGRMRVGNGVRAYDMDRYLGSSVEPVGGVFVVIEITDAEKENEHIQRYTKDWMVVNPAWTLGDLDAPQYIPHQTYDREQYLQSVSQGDEFFAELLTTGRVSVTLEKFKQYIRVRNA